MSYATEKELDAIRHRVTGTGWCSPKQAAVYTGLSHRSICELVISGEIRHSRVGNKKRIRYAELDMFMESRIPDSEPVDLDALVEEAMEDV